MLPPPIRVIIAALCLYGCQPTSPAQQAPQENSLDHIQQSIDTELLLHRYYGGDQDDLLTAGLGIAGLREGAPDFDDPLAPTPRELRRNRIHYHYNALIDTSRAGGFGRLYGPQPGTEKIAGHEYITVSRYPNGDIAATLMVQVPDSFNPSAPCILAAPSSGSRGVYGAVGTVGQWGLSKGCAVAYTDKGTGTGFYIGDENRGYDLLGRLVPADQPGVLFKSAVALGLHRIAVKHSHSGHNPEKDWGRFVLESIQFAFRQLNLHHSGPRLTSQGRYSPENTLVIASSISNGGGGSLKAAEQDSKGWIDAVVVAEPSVHFDRAPAANRPTVFDSHGELPQPRDLLDVATHFALYQGCASLAEDIRNAPLAVMLTPPLRLALDQRCRTLADLGLLKGVTPEEQIESARQKLLDYGILPQTLQLGAFSTGVQLWEAIAVTYANAYGRYKADQPVCNISFAFTDAAGQPVPIPGEVAVGLVTFSSGIVPVAGIQLINDVAGGMALHSGLSYRGGQDTTLEALLCLRNAYDNKPVRRGIRELTFSGDLGGKPAIIVHGRGDNLIHVNHSSRPYLALNRHREGEGSRLRYYEITRAQHFDALLRLPNVTRHFVPLHYYLEQALDIMWSHLTSGTELPPSQVVYARPASGDAADKTPFDLPPILAAPDTTAIRYEDSGIYIP